MSSYVAWLAGKALVEARVARERADILEKLHKVEREIDKAANETIRDIMSRPAPEPSTKAIEEFLARTKGKF